MEAYLIMGRLFVKELSDTFFIRQMTDAYGNEHTSEYHEVEKKHTQEGAFVQYAVFDAGQEILLKDGEYWIVTEQTKHPVLSVVSYRVSNPGKKTPDGRMLPFCDDVYPVILHEAENPSVRITIHGTKESLDPNNWPKILRDGNEEPSFQTEERIAVTYPKEWNTKEPSVYTEFPQTEPAKDVSLDHMDVMEIFCDNELVTRMYWDQISKIWFEKLDAEDYPMVPIKGGSWQMGDYRGKLYNYSFGAHNVNMKKNWLKIWDPKYMGTQDGPSAAGVTGLRDEDSAAKEKDSDFWCFNEDAVTLHEVEVSDFQIGKYHVTMEQFYSFVNTLQVENPRRLFYVINGETYVLNDIAAFSVYPKITCARDCGWGLGQRPATDISYYEMIEYCNWLSRKEGLTPCYRIEPLYQGECREGMTEVNLHVFVEYSCMQKSHAKNEPCQLAYVTCDFEADGYRLPTEAEFEYVIRGGEMMSQIREGKGALYAGIHDNRTDHVTDYAWMRKNVDNPQKNGMNEGDFDLNNMGGNGYTSPVGNKLPSQLGLYDISGNAWDVMNDWFNRTYFEDCKKEGKVTNPTGPSYTKEQMSDMKHINADRFVKDQFAYTYEKAEDGTYTRTGAVSIDAGGKAHHVLRGGTFTNPYPFISAIHRHGAGSYIENALNYTNARLSFRLVRRSKS